MTFNLSTFLSYHLYSYVGCLEEDAEPVTEDNVSSSGSGYMQLADVHVEECEMRCRNSPLCEGE